MKLYGESLSRALWLRNAHVISDSLQREQLNPLRAVKEPLEPLQEFSQLRISRM